MKSCIKFSLLVLTLAIVSNVSAVRYSEPENEDDDYVLVSDDGGHGGKKSDKEDKDDDKSDKDGKKSDKSDKDDDKSDKDKKEKKSGKDDDEDDESGRGKGYGKKGDDEEFDFGDGDESLWESMNGSYHCDLHLPEDGGNGYGGEGGGERSWEEEPENHRTSVPDTGATIAMLGLGIGSLVILRRQMKKNDV